MSVSTDAMDEFEELCARLLWNSMESAPKDRFILLYCAEDNSRWLAKWQGARWFGVDDSGLSREGHSAGDPEVVTGWAINCWRPLPEPPYIDRAHR